MRARDLMVEYPACDVNDPADQAARLIADNLRPAIVVVDQGRPVAVLPASQVVNFVVPRYLQGDPMLARAYDEAAGDAAAAVLVGRRVGDLLPQKARTPMPVVRPESTLMECAAEMAKAHSPLIIVIGTDGTIQGAITAAGLLAALLP
jgi:CBS domain-containing protein